MPKHDKPQYTPNDDGLEDVIVRDEVSRIFKKHPNDYISKLEELGFTYFDDEHDEEEQEEAIAKPLNSNQEYLVSFFTSNIPLSDKVVELYLEERRQPTTNYPLIRKYFKAANKHLLSMILHGLHQYPVLDELLTDLAYFHEFQNILGTVIEHYTIACDEQENLETFSEIAMDFHNVTVADGYDALYALKERYPVGTEKRVIINFLNDIENTGVGEDNFIDF